MAPSAFTMFPTAIGHCGLAWNERGISRLQLPESDDAATRARLIGRSLAAREVPPPPDVERAIDGIVSLLAGNSTDLLFVALDAEGVPSFDWLVYDVARSIPPGQTLTYGEVAQRIAIPGSARAVGAALGRNPWPIIVPCHRVLAAHGRLGGFSAHGGVATKIRLLEIEGALQPQLF
jgi:methylated-DNA-[protein]-cysteine S-methyltransferase